MRYGVLRKGGNWYVTKRCTIVGFIFMTVITGGFYPLHRLIVSLKYGMAYMHYIEDEFISKEDAIEAAREELRKDIRNTQCEFYTVGLSDLETL